MQRHINRQVQFSGEGLNVLIASIVCRLGIWCHFLASSFRGESVVIVTKKFLDFIQFWSLEVLLFLDCVIGTCRKQELEKCFFGLQMVGFCGCFLFMMYFGMRYIFPWLFLEEF